MKKNTGKNSEYLIQEYYQNILDHQSAEIGYMPVDVEHDIVLTGKSGATHQIDVYWEFKIARTTYKTIIEVKDWKTKVKKEQIASFHSVLDDITGNPKGIYVSFSGFQEGAVKYAKHHGIELLTVTEEIASSVFHHVYLDQIHTSLIGLIFDCGWLQSRSIPVEKTEISDVFSKITIYDNQGCPKNVLTMLEDIEDREARRQAVGTYERIIGPEENEEWYYKLPNNPCTLLKVEAIRFKYTLNRSIICVQVKNREFPGYIIQRVLSENESEKYIPSQTIAPIKLRMMEGKT